MSGLTPAQIDVNTGYVCCALILNGDYFAKDGAVKMNHIIQDRARMSRQQAFQVIADALRLGVVWVDKANGKRLLIRQSAFIAFRDKMIDKLGDIEAIVGTTNWQMYAPMGLDQESHRRLMKHVAKGRLAELGGTRAGRAFTRIDAILTGAVNAQYGTSYAVPDEVLTDFIGGVDEEIIDGDFVVVVVRSRDSVVARAVKFFSTTDEKNLASPEKLR